MIDNCRMLPFPLLLFHPPTHPIQMYTILFQLNGFIIIASTFAVVVIVINSSHLIAHRQRAKTADGAEFGPSFGRQTNRGREDKGRMLIVDDDDDDNYDVGIRHRATDCRTLRLTVLSVRNLH